MSLNKQVVGLILFAKNETTYLGGATITGSTDTVQVATAFPVFDIAYSFDGSRKGAQWSGGQLQGTTPSGRSVSGKVRIEAKGLGSAYSSVATPPNFHAFLNASNLSGSFGSNKWTYAPNALGTTPTSLGMEVYDRGEKLSVSGSFAKFIMKSEGAGMTFFEFDVMGVPADITDVTTPPARTFIAASTIPPKNELVNFSIGSYTTANIRHYEFDSGQEVAPRINLNASGSFGGYALGRRQPRFKITIEADALASYNPYGDEKAATPRALSLTLGSVATNQLVLSMPQVVVSSCKRGADGPLATWDLEFTPFVSVPDASDDYTIVLQ